MSAGTLSAPRRLPLRPHLALLAAAVAVGCTAIALIAASTQSAPPPSEADARTAYGKLPLSFVPNRGQVNDQVRYHALAPGFGFFLTEDKAVLSLSEGKRGVALEMRFVGANPDAQIVPGHRRDGVVNYITAGERQANVPTYGAVTYRDLWPGIDMVFRGQGGKLKYEFHVAPGANPHRIRLAYAGADGISLGSAGDLLIGTPLGTMRDQRPVSYQRVNGKRVPVESRYSLAGAGAYGFIVGAHSAQRELVIDPGLEYSTYLGGEVDDRAVDIAVDTQGNAYVVGYTDSPDFPTTPGAFDSTNGEFILDAFVTKLNPAGSGLVYSTFLGGLDFDWATSVAVDQSGSAYVTGGTYDFEFPTTPGAFQPAKGDNDLDMADAFVSKLTPDGSALAYSTYLGGNEWERGRGITVAENGDAYVTGATGSGGFPTTPGAHDRQYNGLPLCPQNVDYNPLNAFVSRLNATGSQLVSSTLLGGRDTGGTDVTLDGSGNVYVVGATPGDFPVTGGAFDRESGYDGECHDPITTVGFVTKLHPTLGALVYSTFLGELPESSVSAIELDSSNNAYVTGSSRNVPTTAGAYDTSHNGSDDAFLAKLNPAGSALVFSTYLGGAGADSGADLARDAGGNVYLTGTTRSSDFPTTPGAFDSSLNSSPDPDVFVAKITPSGSTLGYSTYLGGTGGDSSAGSFTSEGGLALDAAGSAYVSGNTSSTDFPTTAGAYDTSHNGLGDAFVTKLSLTPDGYVRPKGATSLDATLVPAYAPCGAPNRTHGPPLTADSCNPPTRASDELTVGTADSNGKPTKSSGLVHFAVFAGNPATPADEADVQLAFELKDVYEHPALTDYTGEVRLRTAVRITDKLNNPGDNATVSDTTLGATVPCTATADATQGADCSLATTIDALVPGIVPEGKRSVWELGRVQVDDGGADGDADTAGDNTLFMVQGVFVP